MKTAAIFLSLFMLLKPIMPLIEYAAFYDYIVNELCVNKEKPELQCNGKCHLTKELAKASDSEAGNEKNHTVSSEFSFVYFQEVNMYNTLFFPKEQRSKINTSYNNIYKFHYRGFVFHPPLV